jgi:hypothetical protein
LTSNGRLEKRTLAVPASAARRAPAHAFRCVPTSDKLQSLQRLQPRQSALKNRNLFNLNRYCDPSKNTADLYELKVFGVYL